jgi:hypothetical protein
MRKDDFYKGVRTVGFISFIPFMLAAGPLSGYFVGDFIRRKFNLSSQVVLFSVAVGFVAGVMEMVRILKTVARMNKK